ncbi:MAG: hypothetical protein E7586_07125 [Ruminococcaceae bacterium]|nr:hypothetical protein [Oscillospiraceae bacterium]
MKRTNRSNKGNIYQIGALIALAAVAFALFFVDKISCLIVIAGAAVYGCVMFILRKNGKNSFQSGIDSQGMSQLVSSMIEDIDSPVMIVTEQNKIIWCNDEFLSLTEVSQHHITSGANSLFNGRLSYSNLKTAYNEYADYIPMETEDSFFEVKVFPLEYSSQRMYGTVWYSKDNEKRLKKDLDDSAVRVAYIVIDNTNEVTQEVQENRHYGSATVNMLLSEWAKNFSAILTEYDRDKYVMQFENRFLQKMIDTKFDILDKVVEASLDESSVPITISIGVSTQFGTLSEKRDAAQNALKSALQRGGAMAVVRTENGEDSYGGKTKAVQRQTKIRSRLCKDLLFSEISKCSNVIIMGHMRPDFDSIASNIGISKLVQMQNKDFCIVADKNDKNISKIIESIADFPEYKNVFVDAVYAQELLTPDTLVIITDASNPELFAARGVYENASKVIVIDHHAIKETLGGQVLQPSNIDPTASSASELVTEILELSMYPNLLRPEEAQILLAGILLDTQFFSRDTGTRTYSACIYLKNAGAEAVKAKTLFKSNMKQFREVVKIEQRMEVYREIFAISSYMDCSTPENKVTASKAADSLVEIEGISASFVLYLMDDGINLSARSDGTINVINIAKMLGGGGHFQSAGALLKYKNGNTFGEPIRDLDTAMDILRRAIDDYIGDDMKEGK